MAMGAEKKNVVARDTGDRDMVREREQQQKGAGKDAGGHLLETEHEKLAEQRGDASPKHARQSRLERG